MSIERVSVNPRRFGMTVFQVNNPATGDVLANVPFMGKIDAEKAIAAASVAFLRK